MNYRLFGGSSFSLMIFFQPDYTISHENGYFASGYFFYLLVLNMINILELSDFDSE